MREGHRKQRESDRLKKAEYMSYHLGEEFEGIISGVTAYGFYVELPNTVEGLVHVTSLRDDYYSYNEETVPHCCSRWNGCFRAREFRAQLNQTGR